MVSVSLLAAIALIALASGGPMPESPELRGPAPEAHDSPLGRFYSAIFEKPDHGSIVFYSINGTLSAEAGFTNLPEEGGPFTYRIHEKPVPASGGCDATLGDFNPYNGSIHATTPSEHEVGDLSGKHGLITGTSLYADFNDDYLSLNPENRAFFGGLSLVISYANSTRYACANITEHMPVNVRGAAPVAAKVAAV